MIRLTRIVRMEILGSATSNFSRWKARVCQSSIVIGLSTVYRPHHRIATQCRPEGGCDEGNNFGVVSQICRQGLACSIHRSGTLHGGKECCTIVAPLVSASLVALPTKRYLRWQKQRVSEMRWGEYFKWKVGFRIGHASKGKLIRSEESDDFFGSAYSSFHLIVLRCRDRFNNHLASMHWLAFKGSVMMEARQKPDIAGCSVEIRFQMASFNLNMFVWCVVWRVGLNMFFTFTPEMTYHSVSY